MNFAAAIKNRRFSKKSLDFWFNKLVEIDDYDKGEKKEVLLHLYKLSEMPEEGIKQTKTEPLSTL